MSRVLTFDLGATSGRAMISEFDGKTIVSTEIHRFRNDPVNVCGTLYWDILSIFAEIKKALSKACREGNIEAIGIDTWGVDFALIDKYGKMISNPIHYRDRRTENISDTVFKKISKEEIYSETGIQYMRINTLYQLAYLSEYEKETIKKAETLLFIPDLLAYFLTGEKRTEFTIASTSNLLKANEPIFSDKILDALEIKKELFAPLIMPCEKYGDLTDDICEELGIKSVPVYATASHDTASAVAGVPSLKEKFAYISSGTWSLMGTELKAPIVTPESEKYNFTNEKGAENTTRFLKNIMGLWIVEESRRYWEKEGKNVSFERLNEETKKAKRFVSFIDPDDKRFELPGNMPEKIKDYCKETDQTVPETEGDIMITILQSLALKYRDVLEKMKELAKTDFDALHIVGGGINNKLLCSLTSSACNITVFAGPSEAAIAGNAALLYISLGKISSLKDARKIIYDSSEITVYQPTKFDRMKDLKIIKK